MFLEINLFIDTKGKGMVWKLNNRILNDTNYMNMIEHLYDLELQNETMMLNH